MRDVTDLRRRDRMLLSKDATIREIHHRVKNNLQTIASLLRLQGRRLQSPEAQAALEESERRIRSIAIVHETLSRERGDVVRFDEIVQPLVRVVRGDRRRRPTRDLGSRSRATPAMLPGEVATPLAVVLNELMQNAVDHAFPRSRRPRRRGHVAVQLARDDGRASWSTWSTTASGLPPGFTIEQSSGLGLSIVQTLVTSELGGSIELRERRRDARAPHASRCDERRRADESDGERRQLARTHALLGEPDLAQLAALLFGGAAPDAGFLVGGEGELEALLVTVHAVQIRRAVSICSSAGPVLPIGKNTSGSVSRHAERLRHASTSQSWVRIQVSATLRSPS